MNTLINFCKRHYFFILPSVLTIGLYVLLFGIYSINDIDNPWSSAWIYNFFNHHISYDLVFEDGATNYWGVRFFSHIFCYFYGAGLATIGFSLHKIQLISYSLMMLGLINWFYIGKRLLKDKKLAFMFIILLALSGPALNAANEARSDAFIFFLMSVSVLLWINHKHFFSLLFAFMAIETHPIGGLTVFYLFSYFICYERLLIFKPAFLLKAAIGIICGILIYLSFHYPEIYNISVIYKPAHDASINNFIYAFFYDNNHWHFKEDLFVFLSAFIIYFFHYKTKNFYFLLTVLLLIFSSFIFTRANGHYILFIYPALWLMTVYSYSRLSYKYFKLEYLFAIILFLDANHYIHLAKSHWAARQYDQYIMQVKNLHLPKNSYIYANPIDYFAFYDDLKFRSPTAPMSHNHFYLLENIHTVFANDKDIFNLSTWRYTKIKTLHLQSGGLLNVYKAEKRQ